MRDFSHQERLVKDYEEPLSIWDVPLFQNRVNHGLVDELREKVKRGLDYEFKVRQEALTGLGTPGKHRDLLAQCGHLGRADATQKVLAQP